MSLGPYGYELNKKKNFASCLNQLSQNSSSSSLFGGLDDIIYIADVSELQKCGLRHFYNKPFFNWAYKLKQKWTILHIK